MLRSSHLHRPRGGYTRGRLSFARQLSRAGLCGCCVAGLGCGSKTPPKANPPAAPSVASAAGTINSDTLRGLVGVSGSERFDQVTLLSGGDTVALTGTAVPEIARAAGADVWVEGVRESPTRMQVSRFAVRAMGGRPAYDGVLVGDGDRLFVMTADGMRHQVVRPPAALRTHLGARVWVTPPDKQHRARFGVLQGGP